ncbi:ABC transporter substrate-binding protein [Streptomyces litchfieldiae]|uniref:Sugar ABC transporter substrate-binding protein n=1 Tax=Streptomyces litchfieldiae TaxID=3075543 RepID=A0ABU2MPW8_9ACTN|nr:sugar ABC transporter substrate-binding protein [Streptomyces sp. DSM 44938]MDT0343671.1 sugar ABC transporter substrate-binding protein [Streptomyces sp. DSM 44938]
MRRPLTVAASALLALSAATACSSEGEGGGGGGNAENAKIAFLMPDIASTRYELYDSPLFEARINELCADCEVIYNNAQADASRQQQQANSALAQGVSAIVLDPVDSNAAASIVNSARSQGVPVIAYDRPVVGTPADYYISFDNEKIGESIGQSLVDHLEETGAEGGLLQVNGSPTDAAAGLIKDGIHNAIDDSGYELLAEYDTPDWQPSDAQEWVGGQITRFGDDIAGVVAANDGTGGGAIAAFKAAGVPVPPVTGNDFEVAAAQRIVAGDQYNTISKPIQIVAEAAAEVAYQFVTGEEPEGETTLFDTPARLFEPTVVTRENLADVLADSDQISVSDICTAEYAEACAEMGLG